MSTITVQLVFFYSELWQSILNVTSLEMLTDKLYCASILYIKCIDFNFDTSYNPTLYQHFCIKFMAINEGFWIACVLKMCIFMGVICLRTIPRQHSLVYPKCPFYHGHLMDTRPLHGKDERGCDFSKDEYILFYFILLWGIVY